MVDFEENKHFLKYRIGRIEKWENILEQMVFEEKPM